MAAAIALWGFLWTLAGPLHAFTAPSGSDRPSSITVQKTTLELDNLKNPLRYDPVQKAKHLKEGGALYFTHCFLCHGDLMDGRGVFGDRFDPAPANLREMVFDSAKGEPYAFWRIAKGGRGLPESFQPGASVMPAWEETLNQDEIWKVVLYIYETVRHPFLFDPPTSPSAERGEKVFAYHCTFCHAENGNGKGVAAPFSSPRPRNFTKGHYKFRSTAFGKIPTDDDLYGMLTRGMPGTTMPSWKHLPEVDLKSLVLYLKTLGKKFAKFIKKGKSHKIIPVPPAPPFSLASMENGRQLFIKNCSGCHGVRGRGDGDATKKIVSIETDQIRPRNLTKSWLFRRGGRREDIYLTLRTGLSLTAMPRFSNRIHSDRNIWDLVNYVSTLSPALPPPVKSEITVYKTEGTLPLNPESPQWKQVTAFYFPVGGQVMQGDKAHYPTVDGVWVQALYNDTDIAFRFQWDDPTFDPVLKKTASVTQSPPPPLPPGLEPEAGEVPPEPEPKPQAVPDAFAIQFPVPRETATLPYFLNGDDHHPVNLWKWMSHPNATREIYAQGFKHQGAHRPSSQRVQSKVVFRYGQYQLVMKRTRTTGDTNDVQFQSGQTVPIAFNVWDGNEKETGSKMALSSWFKARLE